MRNCAATAGWMGELVVAKGTKMDESIKTERPNGPLDGKFEYKIKQDGTVDRQKVLCTLCWKEFSFHRSNSSLKYHLNAKHQHDVDFANTSVTAAPRLRRSTLTRRRNLSQSEPANQSPEPSVDGAQENSQTQQDLLDTPRLEQREEMNFLEWEGRMKVLALEQELLKEKRQAVRIKKAYYKAKMRRLGEALPESSASSSSDGEEKMPPLMR